MQSFMPRCHSEGMIRIKWQKVLVNAKPGFDGHDPSKSTMRWVVKGFLPNRCTRRLRGWMSMRWQQIIGGYLTVVQMFLCGFFLTRYSVLDLFLNIWGNLLRGISWFQWTSTVSTQVNPLKRFLSHVQHFTIRNSKNTPVHTILEKGIRPSEWNTVEPNQVF